MFKNFSIQKSSRTKIPSLCLTCRSKGNAVEVEHFFTITTPQPFFKIGRYR